MHNVCSFLLFILLLRAVFAEEMLTLEEYEKRSRMVLLNGNLFFHGGLDKNISFETSGKGSVFIDGVNITNLPELEDLDELKKGLERVESDIMFLEKFSGALLNAAKGIEQDLSRFQDQNKNNTVGIRELRTDTDAQRNAIKDLLDRVQVLNNDYGQLLKLHQQRPCLNKPCRYGGTCIHGFGPDFTCLCPPYRTGNNCEFDIDECAEYEGAAAPCKNNATCVNTDTGFECNCTAGYHGPFCDTQEDSCNNIHICGKYGTCIKVDGPIKYRCDCDRGYKQKNKDTNPICVDIDECEENHPCHPGADCRNLPGTFQCSGCPDGFEGNGQHCMDIDECEIGNPCSIYPPVQCINTVGSYRCGSCPTGYTGDGHICVKENPDPCRSNPCHPQAKCSATAGFTVDRFVCRCPAGMHGDGMGEDGCVAAEGSPCNDDTCTHNGDCQALNATAYVCHCKEGHFGDHCEETRYCQDDCRNGGYCNAQQGECMCPDGFFGTLCEHPEPACGKHFKSSEGQFKYPYHFVKAMAECDIVINAPFDPKKPQALQLIFDHFDDMGMKVDGKTDCTKTKGNVTIIDGPTMRAPVAAVFCGDSASPKIPDLNRPILMSGTRAIIRYQGTEGRFSLSWKLVNTNCPRRQTGESGVFSIPHFKVDVSCFWSISVPPGKVIEFTIPALELPSGNRSDCPTNKIEFFDGIHVDYDRRVTEVCEDVLEEYTVRTTEPYATVLVHTHLKPDEGIDHPGFSLKWKAIEANYKCGELIPWDGSAKYSGVIQSPNYGSFYPPSVTCVWQLGNESIEQSDFVIRLRFNDFKLTPSRRPFPFGRNYRHRYYGGLEPPGPWLDHPRFVRPVYPLGCNTNGDYLQLNDGDGDKEVHFCSNHQHPPAVRLTSAKRTVLTFRSDENKGNRGFSIEYDLLCRRVFTASSGVIQSFNFPNASSYPFTCNYTIEAPSTHVVHIKIVNLNIRLLGYNECRNRKGKTHSETGEEYQDYFMVTGVKSYEGPIYCAQFPFYESSSFTASGGKPITITYSTSGDSRNKGFQLEYNTTDIGCGGVLSGTNGKVQSPNYPEHYYTNMHCVYYIQVPPQKKIRLEFEEFNLEHPLDHKCLYDHVTIYEDYTREDEHGAVINQHCGNMKPPLLITKRQKIAIVFVSDNNQGGIGFSAKWEAVDEKMECDRTLTALSGTIIFDEDIEKNIECEFHIALPINSRILLRMNNMSIPCHKAKLTIKNGVDLESSPGFAALGAASEVCDDIPIPGTLRSHSNRVTMKIRSSDMKSVKFNMTYEQIESGCGGTIEGVRGSVSAPQYPLKDGRAIDCTWTIGASAGNKVKLSIVQIDDLKGMEEGGRCSAYSYNFLEIYDGSRSESNFLTSFCKEHTGGEPIISKQSNHLVLRYRQGGSKTAIFGFLARFDTVCSGINLTDFTGSIQSPGYPLPTSGQSHCKWTIRVPRGNRISIQFQDFVLKSQFFRSTQSCMRDNALSFLGSEVYDADMQNKVHGMNRTTFTEDNIHFCETRAPLSIQSRSSTMTIAYESTAFSGNQFWLTYNTIGCVRTLLDEGVIIANRTDVEHQQDWQECAYSIKAPIGQRINVTVMSWNVDGLSKECTTENGNDENVEGIWFYSGIDNSSGVANVVICSSVVSPDVFRSLSQSNEFFILIRMKSLHIKSKMGEEFFRANVSFYTPTTDDNCGSVVHVPLDGVANIYSPNYPKKFERGEKCEWQVIAPDGHSVDFTLKELVLMSSDMMRNIGNRNVCTKAFQVMFGLLSFTPVFRAPAETQLDRSRIPATTMPMAEFLALSIDPDRRPTIPTPPIREICTNVNEEQHISMMTKEARVNFIAGSRSSPRTGGEEAAGQHFGFLLEARAVCGGTSIATEEEHTLTISKMTNNKCNITITIPDYAEPGIYARLDELDIFPHDETTVVAFSDGEQVFEQQIVMNVRQLIDKASVIDAQRTIQFVFTTEQDVGRPLVFNIFYSTSRTVCGGEMKRNHGNFISPSFDDAFECEWTFQNQPGNTVLLTNFNIQLPVTEHCASSYFEIRKMNATGELIGRYCNPGSLNDKNIQVESVWLKLRYQPLPNGVDNVKPKVTFTYYREFGDITLYNGSTVEWPYKFVQRSRLLTWTLQAPEDNYILVQINDISIPDGHGLDANGNLNSGIYFYDNFEERYGPGFIYAASGFQPPNDKLLESNVIYVTMVGDRGMRLRFSWRSLPAATANETLYKNEKKVEDAQYTCGQALTATSEPQVLNYPSERFFELDHFGVMAPSYPRNQNCRWTIARPMLKGLQVRVVSIDLEKGQENCAFDYLLLTRDFKDILSIDESDHDVTKICTMPTMPGSNPFKSDQAPFMVLHFVSDKSRGGAGFSLEYKTTCDATEFIPISHGLFDETFSTPNYPNPYKPSESCSWLIYVNSRRPIEIEVIDLDTEDDDSCSKDYVEIANHGRYQSPVKLCGQTSKYTEAQRRITSPHGGLRINFHGTDNANKRKGVKVRVREIMEDCSSDVLMLDESHPSKVLTSPKWPERSPYSLDCSYTIRAPIGHRIKFTVDHFHIVADKDHDCMEGYLEVHDGATRHASRISRNCDTQKPSTIVSSGNYMHIVYVTDETVQSPGFNATYELDGCGGTVVLPMDGSANIRSTNYPEPYPRQQDCQWIVKAPNTHFVEAKLNHISLTNSVNCSADHLSLSDTNQYKLMDRWCTPIGRTPPPNEDAVAPARFRSIASTMTVDFHANISSIRQTNRFLCRNKKCGFDLQFSASKIACGGRIGNSSGILIVPSANGRLIPDVMCEWTLNAGSGFRYVLDFEFTGEGQQFDYYAYRQRMDKCYTNVLVLHAPIEYWEISSLRESFCQNHTRVVTIADLAYIKYTDMHTRLRKPWDTNMKDDNLYHPFQIRYTRIPVSLEDVAPGCEYVIREKTTIPFNVEPITPYCRIVIERPHPDGTTAIIIKNFSSPLASKQWESDFCSPASSLIDIKGSGSILASKLLNERVCHGTIKRMNKTETDFMTFTRFVDMHIVYSSFHEPYAVNKPKMMTFELTVDFHHCGGVLTEREGMGGVITSPGYGTEPRYAPNMHCSWLLVAPEGHIIQTNVTAMEIQFTEFCAADYILVMQGEDNTHIRRYCHVDQEGDSDRKELLLERNRLIRTTSHIMQIQWKTDSRLQMKGWRMEYEFIPSSSVCGFHSTAVTGIIHTPNFPKDYGHMEECLWEIIVPIGYHIGVRFEYFDVEPSVNCANDRLLISEDHSAQDWAPDDIYHRLKDEQTHAPYCNNTLPAMFHSESNRIRLNFTSNEKITAKGFKAFWTAECGTVYRQSHGIVTSPNYPNGYPNMDQECNYMIDPVKLDSMAGVVTITIEEMQLSQSLITYRRGLCDYDYVDIINVKEQQTVHTFCGGATGGPTHVSVKGPIGIRFVTNTSMMSHDQDLAKLHRGFKISYVIDACGGEIDLSDDKLPYYKLTHPGYPMNYHKNSNCTWTIKTNDYNVFTLKYELFDIEDFEKCDVDSLEIWNGTELNQENSLGKVCGTDTPTSSLIFSNTITVRFVTDHEVEGKGFVLIIAPMLGPKRGCGGDVKATGDWKILRPPLDGNGNFITRLTCGWTLRGPNHSHLELKMVKMTHSKLSDYGLKDDFPLCTNEVTIYDGPRTSSSTLEKVLCAMQGVTFPKHYRSSHSIVFLQYHSMMFNGSGDGFELHYRAVDALCGGEYTADNKPKNIQYPPSGVDFSAQGITHQRCQFIIRAAHQAPISIRFNVFNITSSAKDCSTDYVEVRDFGPIAECSHPACAKKEKDRRSIRYCGYKPNGTAPFISNTMSVQVTSSVAFGTGDNNRFSMEIMMLDMCNRTVNAEVIQSGTVTSPNFPRVYNDNQMCQTDIGTFENKTIFLVFRVFVLEYGHPEDNSCVDSLEIIDVAAPGPGRHHCGSGRPNPYMSKSNSLVLRLSTDESGVHDGYSASYYTATKLSETSYEFADNTDTSGALANIKYPFGYEGNMKLKWTITPPMGASLCTFTFTSLDINTQYDQDGACSEDEYVSLLFEEQQLSFNPCKDGEREMPFKVNERPIQVSTVTVLFYSDGVSFNDGNGFRLEWECEDYKEDDVPDISLY